MWRDLAIGLSLANLCYLRVWNETLTYTRANSFWMKHSPTPSEFAATIVNVVVLGAIIGLGITLGHKGRPRVKVVGRWIFLLLLVVPMNAVRQVLAASSSRFGYLHSPLFEIIGTKGVFWLVITLAVVGLLMIALWSCQLVRIALVVLMLLSPLAALNVAHALWAIAKYDPSPFDDKPLAATLPSPPSSTRAVWIVFDEMDERLTFVDRNPNLQLPELDRLRHESFFATTAYPPGPETQISMPGYVLGHLVASYKPVGPDQSEITFYGDNTPVTWDSQPNVFSRALELGFNTALVGYYQPYCRLLNRSLTKCDWWPNAMQYNSMGDTFRQFLLGETRSLFETNLFSPFGQSLSTKFHVHVYQSITNEASEVVGDRSIGFALLHIPVPHPPHAYDRSTGRFTLKNSPIAGYVDSLALADLTLGKLRRRMELAGTWENTVILVTSDHHYREDRLIDGKTDLRVPFILKLPGKNVGTQYDTPFNTTLSGDLLLAILNGQVSTPEEIRRWLNEERGSIPIEWPGSAHNH